MTPKNPPPPEKPAAREQPTPVKEAASQEPATAVEPAASKDPPKERAPPRSLAMLQVRVRILPDGRMDTINAAKYLGRAEQTLADWRCKGIGPNWVRVGGRIFYYQKDLDAFIASQQQAAE